LGPTSSSPDTRRVKRTPRTGDAGPGPGRTCRGPGRSWTAGRSCTHRGRARSAVRPARRPGGTPGRLQAVTDDEAPHPMDSTPGLDVHSHRAAVYAGDRRRQEHSSACRLDVPAIGLGHGDEVGDRGRRGVQREQTGRVGSISVIPEPSTRSSPGTTLCRAVTSSASRRSISERSTATTSFPHSTYGTPRSTQYSRSIDRPRLHSSALRLPGR
jgi:hypothetical protein